MVTKTSHILKQTCSWTLSVQLQVCSSMCDLFVTTGIKGLTLNCQILPINSKYLNTCDPLKTSVGNMNTRDFTNSLIQALDSMHEEYIKNCMKIIISIVESKKGFPKTQNILRKMSLSDEIKIFRFVFSYYLLIPNR